MRTVDTDAVTRFALKKKSIQKSKKRKKGTKRRKVNKRKIYTYYCVVIGAPFCYTHLL